jgi:hypothetical protein
MAAATTVAAARVSTTRMTTTAEVATAASEVAATKMSASTAKASLGVTAPERARLRKRPGRSLRIAAEAARRASGKPTILKP